VPRAAAFLLFEALPDAGSQAAALEALCRVLERAAPLDGEHYGERARQGSGRTDASWHS
jgi:hypothetical protein